MNQKTLEKEAKKSSKYHSLMKALVITGPGEIEYTRAPIPQPGPSEVLVKMEGSGLCASNIPVWEGRDWFNYPLSSGAPGHEGWGKVAAIGKKVRKFEIGDRVAMLSYNAFAEYDLAKENEAVKLPPQLDDFPFPGEPLGCAVNIFNRSGIVKGETVAVVGLGFLGLMQVQLAKNAGAKVIALSRRNSSLNLALKYGADFTIKMDNDGKAMEEVKNIMNGGFCEKVIEATGKQRPLNLAGELVAEGGRLIIAGYHQDGPREVNMQQWNWRGIDVINAHERHPEKYISGMKEAILAVKDQGLKPFDLFTHVYEFHEMKEAFEMLSRCPEGFIKSYIRF